MENLKPIIFGCKSCGLPLMVENCQKVTSCYGCKTKIYIDQKTVPADCLKPVISKSKAQQIIKESWQDNDICRQFLKSARILNTTLYYIPIYQIRGIHRGWDRNLSSGMEKFKFGSFEFLEPACELASLGIPDLDIAIIEKSLLTAEKSSFDPSLIRKTGIILPVNNLALIDTQYQERIREAVETSRRIVYFPVWEIKAGFGDLTYSSYISAVEGDIIKIQALRSHKLKIFYSMGGLFVLAIILSRGLKLFSLSLMGLPIPTVLLGLIGIPITGFLIYTLLPFFWRIYSQRETIKIFQGVKEFKQINYTVGKTDDKERDLFSKLLMKFNR